MNKQVYLDTTRAGLGFIAFLTFGFIWTTFHKDAPFTAYMEGLILALGLITGKRLIQKWQGPKGGFQNGTEEKE